MRFPLAERATLLAGLFVSITSLHAGTWTPAASMNQSRDWFSGVLMPNGKVLVAGG